MADDDIDVVVDEIEVTVVDDTGPRGEQGYVGWSPALAAVSDGERRVLKVVNWINGGGQKPAIGKYVSLTGLVDDIADGLDVRGAQGPIGPSGEDGKIIIGEGADILTGEGPPDIADGAVDQLYLDTVSDNVYKKVASDDWGDPIANLKGSRGLTGENGEKGDPGDEGPAGEGFDPSGDWDAEQTFNKNALVHVDGVGSFVAVSENTNKYPPDNSATWTLVSSDGEDGTDGDDGAPGTDGDDGAPGDDGWSPTLTVQTDGERRVLQVTDWSGGSGTKPATGSYLGATGLVDAIDDAVDIRGATGAGTPGTDGDDGTDGDNGWSPSFAIVTDSDRRVLQVSDWTGGEGTKPATGKYVGATSLVDAIGAAVDIRGPAGADGDDGAPGADGDDGAPGTDGDDGTPGSDGDDGWSPTFAVQQNDDARVLQITDWVGGSGTKPATGKFVGSTGLVDSIDDAVNIRGAQGVQGTPGTDGDDGAAGNPGLIPGWLSGLQMHSSNGQSFTVESGYATAVTADFAMQFTFAAKTLDAFGTSDGSLDAGTAAANTWYHVHLIGKSSTGDTSILTSLSHAGPTLPTGYDKFRYIGSVLTDSSGDIVPFYSNGNRFMWTVPPRDITGNITVTTRVSKKISTPADIACTAFIYGRCVASDAAHPVATVFTDPTLTDIEPDFNNAQQIGNNTLSPHTLIFCRTNQFSQVGVRVNDATSAVASFTTQGYINHYRNRE